MITDPAEVTRWADAASASDPNTIGNALVELLTLDLRPQASSIRIPVLMIAAGGNVPPDAWPQMMENWRLQVALIPGAELLVIADSKHFIMVDAPISLFDALQTFLAEHP